MDNLNLESDESIIHRTQDLIINGIGFEAVLTGSRIIIVDQDSGTPRESIPYTDIDLAIAGTNRLREPIIQLTVSSPDGDAREIELIFVHQAAHRHFLNRDMCMAVIRDQGVPARLEPYRDLSHSINRKESMDAGTLDSGPPSGRPAVPDLTIYGIAQGGKNSLPEEPPPTSPFVTFIAVIIIAALVIGALVLPIPGPEETATAASLAMAKTSLGATPTPTPVAARTPIPTAATPTKAPADGSVPGDGIYAKITCPSAYSGYFAAGGWRMDVKSSGTQVYLLPVQNTVIDAFIEKSEASADSLDVVIYSAGVPVAHKETTEPRGLVEMHVSVGSMSPGNTLHSEATAGTPAPTTGPVQYAIPATGVWVHVTYPGNYTGTLASNGQWREIDASGNQMYQMILKNGTIDGVLEKSDGSTKPLEVEVYKDGILIDLANTTTPRGVVEIHTRI
jgi:hypothetical protein